MMRRLTILPVLLLAAAVSAAAGPQGPGTGMAERDRWAADLEVLARELPARHKNLYFKITAEEFRSAVEDLKARIPRLDLMGFELGLARLVASVGDSHTSLMIMPAKAFPLKLYWFKEGICVTDTAPEYAALLNGRLTAVDGHPVEEVVRAFAGIFPHDNTAQVMDFVPRFLASSDHLFGLGLIADPGAATWEAVTPAGRTVTVKTASLPVSAARSVSWAAPAPDPSRLPLHRRLAGSAYEFSFLPESKTLYFAYNSCRDLPGRPFAAFAAELRDALRSHPVEKLVIDLRTNGGGDSSILDPLIADLASPQRMGWKGRLFVLIGRRTFSSAILNAIDLKQKAGAVFYGEPTGGRPNHYGEIQALTLPHLKLQVSYSTKYFRHAEGDDPSLMPDVRIDLSLEDHLALRDPVLEAVLAAGAAGRGPAVPLNP